MQQNFYEKQFWATAVYFPVESGNSFKRLEGILDAGFFFSFSVMDLSVGRGILLLWVMSSEL